jgi:large subunit ribosomal protein L35
MPKQKTHKGTKKRFRLTAKGHVKHRHSGTSHLQTRGMTAKRKRHLRRTRVLDKQMEDMVHRAVGKHSY